MSINVTLEGSSSWIPVSHSDWASPISFRTKLLAHNSWETGLSGQWRSQAAWRPCPTSAGKVALIVNRVLNGLEIEQRSIATRIHRNASLMRSFTRVCGKWLTLGYGMATEPTWEAFNSKLFWGMMPPDPPKSFCTLRRSSYKRSVPMMCPSIGDVLATPLYLVYTHAKRKRSILQEHFFA